MKRNLNSYFESFISCTSTYKFEKKSFNNNWTWSVRWYEPMFFPKQTLYVVVHCIISDSDVWLILDIFPRSRFVLTLQQQSREIFFEGGLNWFENYSQQKWTFYLAFSALWIFIIYHFYLLIFWLSYELPILGSNKI